MTHGAISEHTVCYEDETYVRAQPTVHARVNTTIRHWQLRDVVCCPRSREEVYYVFENSVRRFDQHNEGKIHTVLPNLSFHPTSMTADERFVVAGGQRSELSLLDTHLNRTHSISFNTAINNALQIHSDSHGTRLLVSNNEAKIFVLSLPTVQLLSTVELSTPINYASISPDGRHMAACGDTNIVYYFEVSGGDFVLREKLPMGGDAVFSVSWSPTSDKFAAASQDGYVFVWDVRSRHPLAKLMSNAGPRPRSTIQHHGAACRNVKFAPRAGVDLLMFAEHTNHVHLVDTRSFNRKQLISLGDDRGEQVNISGITFSPDSKSIFVGLENALLEYSVDVTGRRKFARGDII